VTMTASKNSRVQQGGIGVELMKTSKNPVTLPERETAGPSSRLECLGWSIAEYRTFKTHEVRR
jgi:hypothetical protein